MTFQFAYTANSPDDARSLLSGVNAPQQVKDFILVAIQGIVSTGQPYAGISVSAEGHLCDGPRSHDRSSLTIRVFPLLESYPR